MLDRCMLCPRNCGVNRDNSELGYCGAGNQMVIGKYYLHKWEEPCISGNVGSGTIFFSYCNLFIPCPYPRDNEMLVTPAFLALSISFTTAPCSAFSSAWISRPSGKSLAFWATVLSMSAAWISVSLK